MGHEHASVDDLEPRLGKAMTWTTEFVPGRTAPRAPSPDAERLAALDEDERLWLALLLDRLPDALDLDAVTALVYGVPKLARGWASTTSRPRR